MRSRKRSALIDVSLIFGMAGHAAMGAALGLGFSLLLIGFDRFGLRPLIVHTVDPQRTTVVLAGTLMLVFAIGATLTGFVLTMMEKHKHSADQ